MEMPDNTIRFDRVRAHTSARRSAEIDKQTDASVQAISTASRSAIDRRIELLDREWDIERYLELTAATISLAGIIAAIREPRLLMLPAVVLMFLAQHAIQGWCPPVPVFRTLGVRTRKEIDDEKMRLLAVLRRHAM